MVVLSKGTAPVGAGEKAAGQVGKQNRDGDRQIAYEEAITRIVAASPFKSASRAEILSFIARQTSALVVLPGSYYSNMPSPQAIKNRLQDGAIVFVEGRDADGENIPSLVSAAGIIALPLQLFSDPPGAKQVDRLSAILQRRTIGLRGRRLTFILCGEINAFSPNGEAKHGRELDHGIIINPAHTTMGHWNFLDRKFTAISRHSIAVHVANNDHDHEDVTTDVRIYRDGQQVTPRHVEGRIVWRECGFPAGRSP